MTILNTSINWAKAEMLSSSFFILFGLAFLLASAGFWQLGKTDVAKAYVLPTLIAGALLLIIGIGIFLPAQARVTSFADSYAADADAFIAAQIAGADRILDQYRIAVFHVIPVIIAVSAILFVFLSTPIWRASLVTTIAMMAVILVIDTNATKRLQDYKAALVTAASRA